VIPTVTSDLTDAEQKHVRTAILFLHQRAKNWDALARALAVQPDTIYKIVKGTRAVTASMAFRVARLVGSSVDDLVGGRCLPANTCVKCGHVPD
jgi:hypothetical protein